jgi:hypothetical protein
MAGGAPCFCPALLDPWASGLPPAYLTLIRTGSGHAEHTNDRIRHAGVQNGKPVRHCRSDESAGKMAEWPLGAAENATGWNPREAARARSLHDRLESLRLSTGLDSGTHWVGLPVIVVAMTRREADEADANPGLIHDRLGQAIYQRFMDLRASVSAAGISIANKYGACRLDCRPFAGLDVNIEMLLKVIV